MERIKNKAVELVDKYYIICQEFTEEIQCSIQAKQCALIAVDEIINTCALDEDYKGWDRLNSTHRKYWDEVYKEIEKL